MSCVIQRFLPHTYSRIKGLSILRKSYFQESAKKSLSQSAKHVQSQDTKCHQFTSSSSHKLNLACLNLPAVFSSIKVNILDGPPALRSFQIDPSVISRISIEDKLQNEKIIEEPDQPDFTEKKAERMIVIRRKKMKKHKLRKLRKRMKFEWARRSQQREKKKEKAFLNELILQIKQAENYSPEKEAVEKRELIQKTFLPLKYEEMPKWYLKEVLAKKEKKIREAEEEAKLLKILNELNKIYKEKGGVN